MTNIVAGRFELQADADAATREGDLATARDRWTTALSLLPAQSQQHTAVGDRLAALTRRMDAATEDGPPSTTAHGRPWWWRGGAGIATAAVEVRNTAATSVGPGYLWTARRTYPLLGETLPERQTSDLLAAIALHEF